MRVLVTGGAGYMGSVLCQQLLQNGHQVRALDSMLHGGQALLPLYMADNFSFMHGDVRDAEVLGEALDQIDGVVNLAAIVGDPACARDPELAKAVNQEAALQLFSMAQSRGIERFVFASTCSNYGRMTDPTQYLDEESNLTPVSLYAETKVAVERTVLDSDSGTGMSSTILRFATLFGLSPRMRFDLTVNTFAMELMTREDLEVYGEQFWRPYVHVRDAARAIMLVLTSPTDKVKGRVFNVGDTQENYTKGQLAELISSETGYSGSIKYVQKIEDPRDYRVSFDRIKDELGFQITRTVQDGVREIVDAIKKGVITDFDNPRYTN